MKIPKDCRTILECMEAMESIPKNYPPIIYDVAVERYGARLQELIDFENSLILNKDKAIKYLGDRHEP